MHHAGRPVHALVAETRPAVRRVPGRGLGAAPGRRPARGGHRRRRPRVHRGGRGGGGARGGGPGGGQRRRHRDRRHVPAGPRRGRGRCPLLVCAPTIALDLATPRTARRRRSRRAGPGRCCARPGRGSRPRDRPDPQPAPGPHAGLAGRDADPEEGVLRAPFGPAIAAVVAAADARRMASPGFAALVRKAAEAAQAPKPRRRRSQPRVAEPAAPDGTTAPDRRRRPSPDGRRAVGERSRAVAVRSPRSRDPARLPGARPPVRGLRDLRPRGPRVRPDPVGDRDRGRRDRRGRPWSTAALTPAAAVRDGPQRRDRRPPARRRPAARRLRRRRRPRPCRPSPGTTAWSPARR